jgi:naphthoate synthase
MVEICIGNNAALHHEGRCFGIALCGLGEPTVRSVVFHRHYSIAERTIYGGTVASDIFVSDIFDPTAWKPVPGFEFTDITYHRAVDVGAVRIAFNRPEVRNAFRPQTVDELYTALNHARMTSDVGAVLLTGNGPSPKDGGWAFCSGGDQRIRGKDGYKYEGSEGVDPAKLGRLHILEVQRLIRFMPKIVIAVVPGWAVGGGHSLHVVCDLTLASQEHAVFKQTDADVASFDGGYGSALLARQVGQKRAREIFFLGRDYSAQDAFDMGMVNAVIPHEELEATALEWAAEITAKSPTAQKMLKYAFNLPDEGLVGQQLFAGEATRLAYGTDEAQEGRDAFLEKRDQDYSSFPWQF